MLCIMYLVISSLFAILVHLNWCLFVVINCFHPFLEFFVGLLIENNQINYAFADFKGFNFYRIEFLYAVM